MSEPTDRMTRLLHRTERVPVSTPMLPGVEEPLFRGPLIEASSSTAVFTVPGVARYRVDTDGGVQTAAGVGATDADVRCFLSGPVRALDLLLHEVFSLLASAVVIDGKAVVICGASATGKSVLAAALAARGHDVLADRLVPIVFTSSGPVVWPTDGCVQLWPPAAAKLGLDVGNAEIVRPALAKGAYRLSPDTPRPAALHRIVVLATHFDDTAPTQDPLRDGAERMRALIRGQLHGPVADRCAPLAHFDWVTRLASGVELTMVSRPRRRWTHEELADRVEALAG